MNDPYDRVSRSPLNHSPSKQLYSFPKAERFNYLPKPYCESFYDAKASSPTRATTFGYGRRNEQSQKNLSPPPDRYRLKTQIDRNIEQRKGYKFGHTNRQSYLQQQKKKATPGPGSYTSKVDRFTNLAFSMGSRIEDLQLKHSNPVGPGDYLLPSMSQTGEYFCSKYRNSGCARTSRSPRFNYQQSKTPGPGACEIDSKLDYPGQCTDMNKQGVYFNSKFKSSTATKFTNQSRSPMRERSVSPGPGAQYIEKVTQSSLFGVWSTQQVDSQNMKVYILKLFWNNVEKKQQMQATKIYEILQDREPLHQRYVTAFF